MTFEEYVAKRKREDGINEFDLNQRIENLRICVNYAFEYFNNYLKTSSMDEDILHHEKKVDKYRYQLEKYDPNISEWLVSLYISQGKYIHRHLRKMLDDDYFLLYDTDAEFRALSYEVYPKASKKFKFLEGQAEMIFNFIKDEHRISSMFHPCDKDFFITEDINAWIYDTYNKYGVNIYNYCTERAGYFYEHPEIWPRGHKHKSADYDKNIGLVCKDSFSTLLWDYDYKQKTNLFGIDDLYRKLPKKKFLRGKKKELEMILMYCWTHWIINDEIYWEEYLQLME